jgi:hypothetical protein
MSEKSGKGRERRGPLYCLKRLFKTSRRSQPLDFNALLTANLGSTTNKDLKPLFLSVSYSWPDSLLTSMHCSQDSSGRCDLQSRFTSVLLACRAQPRYLFSSTGIEEHICQVGYDHAGQYQPYNTSTTSLYQVHSFIVSNLPLYQYQLIRFIPLMHQASPALDQIGNCMLLGRGISSRQKWCS